MTDYEFNEDAIEYLMNLLNEEGTNGAIATLAEACRRMAFDGEDGEPVLLEAASELQALVV